MNADRRMPSYGELVPPKEARLGEQRETGGDDPQRNEGGRVMPYLNPMAMTEEDLALVKRAREVLSTAKVGEVCVLPPDLVAAMRDREIARMEEWRAQQRLQWLHSAASDDVDGWCWGIFRVRWLNDGRGSIAEVEQTLGSFRDLDAAIEKTTGGVDSPDGAQR